MQVEVKGMGHELGPFCLKNSESESLSLTQTGAGWDYFAYIQHLFLELFMNRVLFCTRPTSSRQVALDSLGCWCNAAGLLDCAHILSPS